MAALEFSISFTEGKDDSSSRSNISKEIIPCQAAHDPSDPPVQF